MNHHPTTNLRLNAIVLREESETVRSSCQPHNVLLKMPYNNKRISNHHGDLQINLTSYIRLRMLAATFTANSSGFTEKSNKQT